MSRYKAKKLGILFSLLGWFILYASFYSPWTSWLQYGLLRSGILIFIGVQFIESKFWCCPGCGKGLMHERLYESSEEIRYCAYCGRRLNGGELKE